MSERSVLPSGLVLDHNYEIRRVIGAGGFGIIYEAFDQGLGRAVAVKEYYPAEIGARDGKMSVRPRLEKDGELFNKLKSSFVREARTLSRFEHPAIARVFRVFEGHGTAYMVMSFEAGVTLKEWLAGLGRIPTQDELDRIAGPILSALELMHGEGFVHRDIAPDNIILRDDGTPVLLDFGATRRVMAELTSAVTGLVKRGYSPMEQYAVDTESQGPWSDIYSLGATLYRCVAGVEPQEATLRVLREQRVPAASLPVATNFRPAFLAGIDLAMSLRPEERPQSVAEFKRLLYAGGPAIVGNDSTNRRENTSHSFPVRGTSRRASGSADQADSAENLTSAGTTPIQSLAVPQPAMSWSTSIRKRLSIPRAAILAVLVTILGGSLLALSYQKGSTPTEVHSKAGKIPAMPAETVTAKPIAKSEVPSIDQQRSLSLPKAAVEPASNQPPPRAVRSTATPQPHAGTQPADKQQIERWRQAVEPLSLPIQSSEGRSYQWWISFVERLQSVSNGKLTTEYRPKDSIVPFSQQLDAVSDGRLVAGWSTPEHWTKKSAALLIYTGQVPFGLGRAEFVRWLRSRGESELRALYQATLGLMVEPIPCAVSWPEGFWTKEPVTDSAGFQGLTIRSAGNLPTRVMRRMGATVRYLPGSQVAYELSIGTLSAAEIADPVIDDDAKLWQQAKNYYYPSFHAPATNWILDINMSRWQSMSEAQRGLITEACRQNIDEVKDYEVKIERALDRIQQQNVTVREFSAEIISAAKEARDQTVRELSLSAPAFARAWEGYSSFK